MTFTKIIKFLGKIDFQILMEKKRLKECRTATEL